MKNGWLKMVREQCADWPLKPSISDVRDWPLASLPKTEGVKPDNASLKHYIEEVLDQQETPFCGPASLAAAGQAVFGIRFSMRWLYWQCRKITDLPEDVPGVTFRDLLKVATKIGMCPEELCPTFPDWQNKEFTREMYDAAAKYKLDSYAKLKVGSLEEVEKAISSGKFVLLGTIVTRKNWLDGDAYLTEPEGKWIGGHATLGLEYDEQMKFQEFKDFVGLLNSWGKDQGDGGYFYMAEHYASYSSVDLPGWHPLMEAWAIDFGTELTPRIKSEAKEETKEFDIAPTIIEGRTMLELRSMVNISGGVITDFDDSDPNNKRVTIEYPGKIVELVIGEEGYKVTHKQVVS